MHGPGEYTECIQTLEVMHGLDSKQYRPEVLRAQVEARAVNVSKLARLLGMSGTHLRDVLAGNGCSYETLDRVARALGLSILDVLRAGEEVAA